MLKRFYESKDAIISTLAIVNALVDPLTQEEWEEVEEACRVLESFEQVTLEISGESYVTVSKMILQSDPDRPLRSAANHRMEYNHVLSETTALDPRFKKLAFSDARAIDEALQRITSAAVFDIWPIL
ncbi:hypothetical protein PO909_008492 [Leuciscus waleckii]